MKPTLNEKFLAYLALFSGLTLSVVAEYYSILGLTAIFAAAVIPVVIMGIALGLGKISATLWLKQNWNIAPWSVRSYLFVAILVLMLITSMGIFGFLSKAHSDQSLVSGDVAAKIAVYDEKIKVAKDNIDANRKALKQMDEAVDQVMGRSQDEKGADKAVALRRGQSKERARLLAEIQAEQKTITQLSEERAPIAAEVRKVEAEVGPIKYIAAFVYGDTDTTVLEKAVTWVIIILIVVFDPLAVILLLASQISFQNFRERENPNEQELQEFADAFNEVFNDPYVADVGEKPTQEEKDDFLPTYEEITPIAEGDSPEKESDVVSTATVTESILEQHPYLNKGFTHFKGLEPMVAKPEETYVSEAGLEEPVKAPTPIKNISNIGGATKVFKKPAGEITEEVVQEALEEPTVKTSTDSHGNYVVINGQTYHKNSVPSGLVSYVQNEEQSESSLWTNTTGNAISHTEYIETSKNKKD